MKAGTTWLYGQLSKNPEIYFTPEKELHYFSHIMGRSEHFDRNYRFGRFLSYLNKVDPNDVPMILLQSRLKWYADFLMNVEEKWWYRRVFDHRGSEKYCADFSNLNAFLEPAGWENVKAASDNLKVLFTMRDPVNRLWSHMRFHNAHSGLNLDLENMPLNSLKDYALQAHFQFSSDYALTVRNLQAALPPETYQLSFFETLHEDPAAWLYKLEAFLDVPHHDYGSETLTNRVNVSRSVKIPPAFSAYMRHYYQPQIDALHALGVQTPSAWQEP